MKASLNNRFIRGKTVNRMVCVDRANTPDGNEPEWCDRYLATIEKRKQAIQTALKRHWAVGGQVLEYGFSGVQARTPGESPDSLHDADSLADLLANRCAGFNLQIELVNTGAFPCSGND